MVERISFGSGYNSEFARCYSNLVKYVGGTQILPLAENPFAGAGIMMGILGISEGVKGVKWLRKTYRAPYDMTLTGQALKDARKAASPFSNGGWKTGAAYKTAWDRIKASSKAGMDNVKTQAASRKALFSNGGWKQRSAYLNLWNNHSANTILTQIPDEFKMAQLKEAAKTSDKAKEAVAAYERAANAAKRVTEGNLTGTSARRAIKVANARFAQAEALAHGQIPKTGFFAKIGKPFSKLNGGIKTAATKSNFFSKTLAKGLKFGGKGNGWILAISGALELFTQVIPTFKTLGAEKGMKQLGKSTAKTAASVGGWAAGAAIGAAIGSVIPVAGTAVGGLVGALCGFIGGSLGAWGATKATEAIVGKNELDIAKEQETAQITREAMKNPEAGMELMMAAAQKLETEGVDSPDAQIAADSLQKLANSPTMQGYQNQVASNSNDTNNGNSNTDTSNYLPSSEDLLGLTAQNHVNSNGTNNTSFQGRKPQANNFSARPNFNNMFAPTGMSNKFFQDDFMDKDLMAMSIGLG